MTTKAASAVLVLCVLLAGCSGGDDKKAVLDPEPTSSPTASPTASPAAKPAAPRPVLTDFLTGQKPRQTRPVVAIKVDNSTLARPYHRGLREAAIIYQELVEGGATRLLAVMESGTSGGTEVGPIRSVRESDIELLRQFGTIAVGFSGGNTGVKNTFAEVARAGHLIDASYDAIPPAYRLGERRRDARNFFTTPEKLVSRRPGHGPKDIGLRFGALSAGGIATGVADATFSPHSSLRARYDGRSTRWVLSQGGSVIPVSPANVIVQYVTIRSSRYSDVNGMSTPYTVTQGTGRAVVLRDGKRFKATWKRRGLGPTHFLDNRNKDVRLKPGPTWILLLPSNAGVTYG